MDRYRYKLFEVLSEDTITSAPKSQLKRIINKLRNLFYGEQLEIVGRLDGNSKKINLEIRDDDSGEWIDITGKTTDEPCGCGDPLCEEFDEND